MFYTAKDYYYTRRIQWLV